MARPDVEGDEDEPYDDEQDHDKCEDCKGTGEYVGLNERRHCPTCDGSGYV
jgi:DnaJ-class molecular chaperone